MLVESILGHAHELGVCAGPPFVQDHGLVKIRALVTLVIKDETDAWLVCNLRSEVLQQAVLVLRRETLTVI